jgi:hypothetical protein
MPGGWGITRAGGGANAVAAVAGTPSPASGAPVPGGSADAVAAASGGI